MDKTELTVWELGEDGDCWFVQGASGPRDAKAAVSKWLDETLGNGDDRASAQEYLDAASSQRGRWWFATGHREGQMVNNEEPPTWLEGVRLQ